MSAETAGTEAFSAGRMCVSFLNDSDEKTLGGVLCMHVDGVVLGGNGATYHSSVVVFVLLGRLDRTSIFLEGI